MPDDEVDRFFDLELSDIEKNGLTAIDIAKLCLNLMSVLTWH